MKYMFTLICLFAVVAIVATAEAGIDRSKAPKAGPVPKVSFPKYSESKVAGGAKFFVVEQHSYPDVTLRIAIRGGASADGQDYGLAELTSAMLTKGTTKRSALKIAEEIDILGSTISASADDDGVMITVTSLKRNFGKTLEVLADILTNANFPSDELEKLRTQTLSSLKDHTTQPTYLANHTFAHEVFGDHPYGNDETETTVKGITSEKCATYYKTYFSPTNAVIVAVGDVTPKELEASLGKALSKWKAHDVPLPAFKPLSTTTQKKVVLIDRGSAAAQTTLRVGHLGVPANSPEREKIVFMNTILGGYFGSRINYNLREQHSYTYGGFSNFDVHRLGGAFAVQVDVRNDVTDKAVIEIFKEIDRMRSEKISEEELNSVKEYLSGNFLIGLENATAIASRIISMELLDMRHDYYANFLKAIASVTREDVLAMAKKYLQPERMVIVGCGNASEIADGLEKIAPVQVIDVNGNPVQAKLEPVDMTPEKLFDKMVESIGGREALERNKQLSMEAEATIQGQKLIFVERRKSPMKCVKKVMFGAFPVQVEVCDGEHVWSKNQSGKIEEKAGSEKSAAMLDAAIDDILHYGELGVTSKILGKKGQNIVVEQRFGKDEKPFRTLYVDAGTYLISKDEKHESAQGADIVATTEYSDWRGVNGVRRPHEMKVVAGPQMLDVIVTKYETSGVEDKEFAKPE